MTLQRQSLPALPSSPLHHFIPPQKPLRPYLLGSCSSASPPTSLSLSCFMAVDLSLEHLPSRVRERTHARARTHTHTDRIWGRDEERLSVEEFLRVRTRTCEDPASLQQLLRLMMDVWWLTIYLTKFIGAFFFERSVPEAARKDWNWA